MAGGEAFAPLLNYMYTGRLEVTLDNVYSVLLATHLLHMPGALEQCRAALLRLRAPPPPPPPLATSATSSTTTAGSPQIGGTSILRPIPNRLVVGPPLCWPPTTPLAYSPASAAMSHHLPPSMQPLMRSTTVTSSIIAPREKQEQCAHYRLAVKRWNLFLFHAILVQKFMLLRKCIKIKKGFKLYSWDSIQNL